MNDYNIYYSFIQLSGHPFHLTMIGKKNIKKNVSELLINYLKYFRSFYKAACIHRRQSLDQKKYEMNFFLCGLVVGLLIPEIEVCQAILCKEASLSCPVITRNHRRLKGFKFKTFHLASLISCGLLCQRDPRCVSTNFRKVFKREGTCELNDRGVLLTEKGNELEYDEEAIYTQFYDTKVTKKVSIKDEEKGVTDSTRYLSFIRGIFLIKFSYIDDRCEKFLSLIFSLNVFIVWPLISSLVQSPYGDEPGRLVDFPIK